MAHSDIPRRAPELVEAARSLAPAIRAAAPAIERERRLPDEIVKAMQQAGIFGMTMPRSLGGPEADPLTQLEVVEALSVADGSVGWVAMIGSDGGFYCAHLALAVARELYPDREAVTASVLVPKGRAERVAGGYRVSGRWPFGSACLHAEWFVGGSLVFENGKPAIGPGGHPQTLMSFFPASQCEIFDTWHTTGLAGSGSHDWGVASVFVPEERCFDFMAKPRDRSPLYAFPWFVLANSPGVPLGIARASIESLCELAAKKTLPPRGTLLRDDVFVQSAIARAEAALGSARAYLFEALGELWATVCAGREPALDLRARFRLATIHAYRSSRDAVQLMYEAGGGSALYASSPLDRQWRDITTVAQHALVNERGYGEVGRALLGLDPDSLLL
jgi:alkylation response protein AidB-like acyl-CoA dehydrogenase